MNVPAECRYTKTHEWAKKENARVRVGVTEYAQKELSDVVYVELPAIGKVVAAGKPVCVVESVKAAFDIYSPYSGTVREVNAALESDPALINTDPYGKGWIFILEPDAADTGAELMDSAAYQEFLAHAAH